MPLIRPHMVLSFVLIAVAACSGDSSSGGGDNGSNGTNGTNGTNGSNGDGGVPVEQFAELWYSVDDVLVYIPISSTNGNVGDFVVSEMSPVQPLGQNMLTMLPDGSLLGGRLSGNVTTLYHIAEPPRDGSAATVVELGTMIDELELEGLYTDCDGRIYGMDTGVNDTSSEGNRLIRFTGDVLSGDFNYAVISDLGSADVADIDDMGPAIVDGNIRDNPGLAIDTGTVYNFNYETGSGTEAGDGGTFGIHALGRELFDDDTGRLYVFSSDANLFEMDPVTNEVSDSLGTGPQDLDGSFQGHSGLAGPLTNCSTGFTIE